MPSGRGAVIRHQKPKIASAENTTIFHENHCIYERYPASGPLRGTVGRDVLCKSRVRRGGAPSGAAAFIIYADREYQSFISKYYDYRWFLLSISHDPPVTIAGLKDNTSCTENIKHRISITAVTCDRKRKDCHRLYLEYDNLTKLTTTYGRGCTDICRRV
jgi:hypothetical protein